MFPIPDALAAFYLICFVVGFLFVFVSLFLGLGHDALHIPGFHGGDGGVDSGGAGHGGLDHGGFDHGGADHIGGIDGSDAGAHGDTTQTPGHVGMHEGHAGHGPSPINISTVMAFLTWFGGAGYILRAYAGVMAVVSLVAAVLIGLLGGTIIFYFLARVILPGQRILDPADYELIGTIAKVTMPMSAITTGEVVYSKGGSRRSDGARSKTGETIERGSEVVIVGYERGIAYVEPWKSYVEKG